jgi:hypothetical protein
MVVSDGDDDAETLPVSASSSESDHTPEEGEYYCGGVLYTAQWCMLEYRRLKSRRSGIYLPSPAETMIRNTVVLKDWSFVALDPKIKPKHLGFRATGTLVNNHPRVAESKGRFWESTEIRGVHSNCVVQSANKNLFYRLDGGVYNHILMILKVRPFLKVAAAAVALLATTAYLSKKLLVRISTIRQKKNFFVCFVQKGTILFREASGLETFASNALFVWVNYGQVLTGAMRGKYPALVPT